MKIEGMEMVNHPNHYNQGGIECLDAMLQCFGKDAVVNFCTLNTYKYLWRCESKGSKLQDLKKAEWYIKTAIELLNE